MNDIFENYWDLISSSDFIRLCKTVSYELNIELGKDQKEVETVKNWINVFNKTNPVKISRFNIAFNAIFIHGYNHSEKDSNPSGVEFDYINNSTDYRELADIIFVTSFYYKQQKLFEKISFNQAKWGHIKKTTSSWEVAKEQLFLLSRFPRFSGINGSFIPNKDYHLNDFSKGLGSYGFMTKENFIFISAYDLQTIIGGRGTVNLNDLKYLQNDRFNSNRYLWHPYFFEQNISIPFCNNTYSFVTEYLQGNIGELIKSEHIRNVEADNLFNDLLSSIAQSQIEGDTPEYNENISNFLKNYDGIGLKDNQINNQFEFKKGMGIIQVKIKLDDIKNE